MTKQYVSKVGFFFFFRLFFVKRVFIFCKACGGIALCKSFIILAVSIKNEINKDCKKKQMGEFCIYTATPRCITRALTFFFQISPKTLQKRGIKRSRFFALFYVKPVESFPVTKKRIVEVKPFSIT